MIEQGRLREALRYDPETGDFWWKCLSKFHREKTGQKAGTIRTSRGKKYLWIQLDGIASSAHRLAWLYVHGSAPPLIDHINGDSLDNRVSNLRPATRCQNAQNHTKSIGKSGLPVGVRLIVSSGRFQARITANKIVHYLGVFDTPEEASNAYRAARKEYHDAPAAQ